MSVLTEEELEFDFSAAIRATRFDDENHKMNHCMKAVDFLVEWDEEFCNKYMDRNKENSIWNPEYN